MRLSAIGFAGAVCAVASAQPAAPTPGLPYAPGHYLLQALLSLALVIALIYGVYWLLRRVGPGCMGAAPSGPAELLQSVPLHGGYVLHVVRVGRKLLALTCGPGGVAATEVPPEVPAASVDDGEEGDAR
ncbi:hypothetical protein LLH23_12610 [bacterium]|nr:hypothetical protein [bacterium]